MLNKLTLSHAKGDLLGGLTAAIVSLPLALAFGVASGIGPEAGLYGAMLVGLFASLFGGTSTLISEPTGPMTVVMTAVITSLVAADPDQGLAMAFTVVILAGFFQILFGLIKLGKYITLMPYSVVSGFMSGIGCVLILLQLAPVLGQDTPPGGSAGTLIGLPDILQQTHWMELGLAISTLALLLFSPKVLTRRLPPQLIALVSISLFSVILFEPDSIRRIGEIDVGLPALNMPVFSMDQIQTMLIDALILGMLGCIDSMLTSVIADNLTRTEHNSNKELVGQGVGNIASGLFGGLPGAGATMGTVINIQSGGKTALSGIIRVLVLAIAVFGVSHWLEHIPIAVLAAITIKVGIDILDWSFIKRAHKVSWQSAAIMYAVLLLTVFVDLIVAVGVGIFIANILIIEKLSRSQEKNIKSISDIDDEVFLTEKDKELLNLSNGKVLLVYLSGPMIFGVAKALSRQHALIEFHKVIVFDLTDVSLLDDTICLALENTIEQALSENKQVYLAIKNCHSHEKLRRMGMLDRPPKSNLFESRTDALQAIANLPDAHKNLYKQKV